MIVRVVSRWVRLVVTGLCTLAPAFLLQHGATWAAKPRAEIQVDFNRQILPLLSDNCFACHGPDEKQRKAKLRLDTKEGAFKELRDGGFAIAPGKSAGSQLIARICSDDPSVRMPPPKAGQRLTPAQIELFRRWVDEG